MTLFMNYKQTDRAMFVSRSRALFSLLAVVLLFVLAVPSLHAQKPANSGDAFVSVDQVMRFMRSANYSEEELLRRIGWTDQLVNEMASYRPVDDDRQNYLRLLDIAINHYQDENVRLRILLRAVTTLDPLVQKYFPQWVVQDEPTILEVMRKVRDNRDDLRDAEAVSIAERVLTGKARLRVVQSPQDQDNLIAIIIEKARPVSLDNPESAGFLTNKDDSNFEDYRIVGRRSLREILTPDLYDKVVKKEEYPHLMETGAIKPEPYVAEANLSIPFGGGFMWTLEADERADGGVSLQVSRIRAGFELKIGNDWVNLPFHYGPQWNALIAYEPTPFEIIKVGPAIPFTWGDESINTDFPLFKERRLNGTWGASGEYWKQLSNISGSPGTDADGIGAAAFVSFGLKTFGKKKLTAPTGMIINGSGSAKYDGLPDEVKQNTHFYYLTSTATAYYWRDLGFMLNGLRGSLGLGYQKLNEARLPVFGIDFVQGDPRGDSVIIVRDHSALSPWARLEYNHRGKTTYGAAVQYFNSGLMGELYLNIFSWMRAQVKYSRIFFRDVEKWEHEEMIVPGLAIKFAF